MKSALLSLTLLLLVLCTSCSSYEEIRKKQTAVEQSISEFHARLNNEQYQDIYAHADDELHNRISETDFTARLRQVHERLGETSDKPFVLIDDGIWRSLHKLLWNKETVMTTQFTHSASGTGVERFQWEVKGNEAKLADYNLSQVLEPGKVYGIGLPKNR